MKVNASVSSILTSWALPVLSMTRNMPFLISKRATSFGSKPELALDQALHERIVIEVLHAEEADQERDLLLAELIGLIQELHLSQRLNLAGRAHKADLLVALLQGLLHGI